MNSLKPYLSLLVATLLLALAVPVAAQAPAPLEEEEFDRSRKGVFFGLNLGAGLAEGRFGVSNHPEIDQEREVGVGLNTRLGLAVKEWLLVGVAGTAWAKNYALFDGETQSEVPADVSYSIAGGFVQVFFYRDFFARATTGAAFTSVHPRNEKKLDESGFGYAFGLGWEARLTETLALTPLVEYGRVLIDNVEVESDDDAFVPIDPSATFGHASLGLTWYF